MPLSRVAVLDCGASHAAFGVFARAGKQRWRLEQFAWESFPLGPGREDDWSGALAAALAALRSRVKYRGPVTLVLPGHVVLTKFIRTPRVDAAKRAKIVRFEAQQNIPYALTDVVWDHAVVGETDLDLEVMLCAAKLEVVDALCRTVEQAGFAPRVLLPSVQALAAAYRSGPGAGAAPPTLVLNVGARTTLLLLVQPAALHARTLALGGNAMTQLIAESQDCDFAEAETIKLAERNASVVEPATEAFATRLAQEITRSALHFKRQSGAASPARVLLTGGAARLPGLATALSGKLNTTVGIFDPLGGIEIARAAADAGAAEHAEAMSDLIGAAFSQLHDEQPAMNLLPPRLRARESTRKQQPWLVAAAVLAAAALLLPLHHTRELGRELRAKTIAVEAEIAPLRERDARNRRNLEQLEEVTRQLTALQSIGSRRDNWLAMLADLQERLVKVEDVWLERMQLAPSPNDPQTPLRIAVSGRMLDKTNPLANVSPDIYQRVTTLLGRIVDSPFVSAVEGERFDNRQPGILQFDFILVAEPARPL